MVHTLIFIRHGVVTGKVMVGEVLEMQVSHVRPMGWGGVMWVLWVGMMCLSTGIAEAHGERELRPPSRRFTPGG